MHVLCVVRNTYNVTVFSKIGWFHIIWENVLSCSQEWLTSYLTHYGTVVLFDNSKVSGSLTGSPALGGAHSL